MNADPAPGIAACHCHTLRHAARLGMDRATLGHNVRPMLAQGWLVMAPGEDRRRRDIALSAEGREVLTGALPLWQAALS